MTQTHAMPAHLTGELATLWNKLREQAGTNPEVAIKVTDATDLQTVEALSTVGGCTVEKVADGAEVTLLFEPEAQTETMPEEAAVAKPHKFAAAHAMPAHLTGELATLWNKLREQAGTNPEVAIKVTDATDLQTVEALSTVGGCTVEKVADGAEVTLLFEPEAQTETMPEEAAVAKPHKFANEE